MSDAAARLRAACLEALRAAFELEQEGADRPVNGDAVYLRALRELREMKQLVDAAAGKRRAGL